MSGESWVTTNLGTVAEIVMGQSPPGHTYNEGGHGVPLINGPVEFGRRFPFERQWTTRPTKMCLPGDVLFCVRGSTTGRMNVSNGHYCIGRGVAAIRGRADAYTPYLELVLRKLAVEILEEAKGSGSTFPSVNANRLAESPVRLPPLPEQRRIAEILDTLDEAIRKTEQVIAKLQRMKQGLLHDLLTRGIDENGELRDPLRHPEQFKDSPLGRIPKEWEVVSTGQVSRSIVPTRDKPLLDGGKYPWVTVSDLATDIVAKSAAGLSLSIGAVRTAGARVIPPGTVLMSCVGTFGLSAIAGVELVTNQQLHGFVVDERVLYPMWLALNIRRRAREIDQTATQTTIKYLNKAGCESVLIPRPCVKEQREASSRLDAVAQAVEVEQRTLSKLRLLKQGLMGDLLTGHVRVKVTEAAE